MRPGSNNEPTGQKSTTPEGADVKGQVDSENQVTKMHAQAGYDIVQNPTRGPNPAVTPERLRAEGLNENAHPDNLIENRIWDTYTPKPQADARSIVTGIQEKINAKQTHRVVVDLRGTKVTPAQVRAAATGDYRFRGVKELNFVTDEGLGKPFRP